MLQEQMRSPTHGPDEAARPAKPPSSSGLPLAEEPTSPSDSAGNAGRSLSQSLSDGAPTISSPAQAEAEASSEALEPADLKHMGRAQAGEPATIFVEYKDDGKLLDEGREQEADAT